MTLHGIAFGKAYVSEEIPAEITSLQIKGVIKEIVIVKDFKEALQLMGLSIP